MLFFLRKIIRKINLEKNWFGKLFAANKWLPLVLNTIDDLLEMIYRFLNTKLQKLLNLHLEIINFSKTHKRQKKLLFRYLTIFFNYKLFLIFFIEVFYWWSIWWWRKRMISHMWFQFEWLTSDAFSAHSLSEPRASERIPYIFIPYICTLFVYVNVLLPTTELFDG